MHAYIHHHANQIWQFLSLVTSLYMYLDVNGKAAQKCMLLGEMLKGSS